MSADKETRLTAADNHLIGLLCLALAGWLMIAIGLFAAFGWPALWIWFGLWLMVGAIKAFLVYFDSYSRSGKI